MGTTIKLPVFCFVLFSPSKASPPTASAGAAIGRRERPSGGERARRQRRGTTAHTRSHLPLPDRPRRRRRLARDAVCKLLLRVRPRALPRPQPPNRHVLHVQHLAGRAPVSQKLGLADAL